ncbi:hypothetical protein [Pseudaestuariivita rosea]|uniref:hypothetical protein n=1 Tax=Pseudaestuariivita rosea TaxID=2763263 RepID=UPI001ABB2E26|nr:hypothetical protein [Pseudaestuariivita rosea]
MDHLQPFRPRPVLPLSVIKGRDWHLKRYAILADGRVFDDDIADAASAAALDRLPRAGDLLDGAGNHGVGFQIIHFAEIAVVSPTFYWQWGSVLAKAPQIRARWEAPTVFGDGVDQVVGCLWEMDIVRFETDAWRAKMLGGNGTPPERLVAYFEEQLV